MRSLAFLVVLIAIPAALSLKCYVCSDCGDKNGDETLCPSGKDKCGKVYMKTNDIVEIGRTCANQTICDMGVSLCDAEKKARSDVECDAACCDSDLCNSGVAPSFSVLLVSLLSLLAVVLMFK